MQMVRFFYKAAAQQKAKVLRKVSFESECFELMTITLVD